MRSRLLLIAVGMCLLHNGALRQAPAATASSGSGPVAETPVRSGEQQKVEPDGASPNPAPPEVDLMDYFRKLLKKPPKPAAHGGVDVSIIPYIGSKPPQGIILGGGASLEFSLGYPAETRISTLDISGSYSSLGQFSITWSPEVYGNRDRWLLQGNDHFQLALEETYGLGTSAPDENMIRVDFHSLRIFESWYRQIFPHLYAGAGLRLARQSQIKPTKNYTENWQDSPFVVYSQQHGMNLTEQTAAGLSLNLIFDNRDNQNDPYQGIFAQVSYRPYFKGFLGGSSQWQELCADFRKYKPLSPNARHRLAIWSYVNLVTAGAAPYFSLPGTGEANQGRTGRGYPENRFRGERMLYGEAEYRVTLTRNGLLGMVFFVNGTTLSSSLSGEGLFDSVAVGGGVGVRFRLHKRSRTNIGVDFGFGRNGSHGIYLDLAEAF